MNYIGTMSRRTNSQMNEHTNRSMENREIQQRLAVLEAFINNPVQNENRQIKQLQDRIEILEEELKQRKMEIGQLQMQVRGK